MLDRRKRLCLPQQGEYAYMATAEAMRNAGMDEGARLIVISILLIISVLSTSMFIATSVNKNKTQQELNQIKAQLENKEDYQSLYYSAIDENSKLLNDAEENDKLKQEIKDLKDKYDVPEPKVAYLTFDDGVSSNTDKILDILKQKDVKATFFPNWRSGEENAEKYRRIVNEGHTLGNHTYNHEWADVYKNPESFRQSVTSLNEKLKEITGQDITVFRFPGGSNNTIHKSYVDNEYANGKLISEAIKILHELGMEYYDWNVDSGDASSRTPLAKDKLVSNVVNGARQNTIYVLMHDTRAKPTTVEALPEIIDGLRAKGYEFKALTSDTATYQFIKS